MENDNKINSMEDIERLLLSLEDDDNTQVVDDSDHVAIDSDDRMVNVATSSKEIGAFSILDDEENDDHELPEHPVKMDDSANIKQKHGDISLQDEVFYRVANEFEELVSKRAGDNVSDALKKEILQEVMEKYANTIKQELDKEAIAAAEKISGKLIDTLKDYELIYDWEIRNKIIIPLLQDIIRGAMDKHGDSVEIEILRDNIHGSLVDILKNTEERLEGFRHNKKQIPIMALLFGETKHDLFIKNLKSSIDVAINSIRKDIAKEIGEATKKVVIENINKEMPSITNTVLSMSISMEKINRTVEEKQKQSEKRDQHYAYSIRSIGREIFELKEETRLLKDTLRQSILSNMGTGGNMKNMGDYLKDDIESIRDEIVQPKEEVVRRTRTSSKKKALFKYIRNLVIAIVLGGLSIFIGMKLTLDKGRSSHADIISPYSHRHNIDTSLPNKNKEKIIIKEGEHGKPLLI